jgi:hypothetical protein
MRWLLLVLLIAGCATSNTVGSSEWPTRYTKSGVTSDQLTTDGLDCHWKAPGPKVDGATAFWVGGRIGLAGGVPTAETHAACMRAKGYTVNP